MLLTTIEIRKTEVEVHVNNTGHFFIKAVSAEERSRALGSGDTLEKAKQAASVELRRRAVKVSVPFRTTTGEQGIAHSRHAGNNDVMTIVGGATERYSYRLKAFKPETPTDVIEAYLDHADKIREHEGARRDIESTWYFDLGEAVDAAIEAASQEVGEVQA
jgi:hypothetical protein